MLAVSSEPRARDTHGETQHQGPPGRHCGRGGLQVGDMCGVQMASSFPSIVLVVSRVPAVEGHPISGGQLAGKMKA